MLEEATYREYYTSILWLTWLASLLFDLLTKEVLALAEVQPYQLPLKFLGILDTFRYFNEFMGLKLGLVGCLKIMSKVIG